MCCQIKNGTLPYLDRRFAKLVQGIVMSNEAICIYPSEAAAGVFVGSL